MNITYKMSSKAAAGLMLHATLLIKNPLLSFSADLLYPVALSFNTQMTNFHQCAGSEICHGADFTFK